jgi:chromosome segregation ATPase
VSTKPDPLLKQWLTTGSIAFIASCGCSLPFTQNLAQSALIGLATLPGVAASMTLRSRQRHQQVHRQLKQGKLRLHQLHHRGAILHEQLQLQGKDRQAIESRVAQLHSLAASLTDRIEVDRDRHQQLEQQLSSLTIYCDERQNLATNLDRKIQDKLAYRLEVDTDLNNLRANLSHLQSQQIQLTTANDSFAERLHQQAKIELVELQSEITRCAATKQELELNIQQLQSQQTIADGDFDESVEQKHLLLHQLDSAISDRVKVKQDLTAEIDRLEQTISEKAPELTIQDRQLGETRSQLHETELELQVKQAQLQDLAADILNQNNEIESRDRALKMAQLELSSKQAELDNLEFKIHAKRQSIDDPDPWLTKDFQTIEPQPPTIDRDLNSIVLAGKWQDKFIDNPHLTILQHIEKHGTITEAEASSKLGNARSVRQFANKLEEYTPDLPFSIRVESSPKGNRYLKETQS